MITQFYAGPILLKVAPYSFFLSPLSIHIGPLIFLPPLSLNLVAFLKVPPILWLRGEGVGVGEGHYFNFPTGQK